jgi:hypothetical protein
LVAGTSDETEEMDGTLSENCQAMYGTIGILGKLKIRST